MSNKAIYLDYAATTPVDPEVAQKMAACLTEEGLFGNAASTSHMYGWQALEAVENARQQVAEVLGADIREIVFTSGATESNNLAIKGIAFGQKHKGKHIVTSSIEHKAVLDVCQFIETQGFEVTYLKPNCEGVIEKAEVAKALRDDTILLSLMHVNNETGAINDIAAFGELARGNGTVFHVDAAQSFGKLAIDCKAMKIDLLSVSAHKIYGPKGSGALYVGRQQAFELEMQMHGGGHERGFRSGTLATHQIVGLGEAAKIAHAKMQSEAERLLALRERLFKGIEFLPGVKRNSNANSSCHSHLNICFSGVKGEVLLMALRKLAVSTGSACNSASLKPSYVLTAMGLSDADADSSIRLSLGRFTSEQDIDNAIGHIVEIYGRLQQAV